jgi:hypothetical protein
VGQGFGGSGEWHEGLLYERDYILSPGIFGSREATNDEHTRSGL